MSKFLFNLSFRLWHPTQSAEGIISQFDLTPRFSNSVGENRRTPAGTPLEGFFQETYISFSLARKKECWLDEELMRWCDYLEKREPFLSEFRTTGGRLEFYVSAFLKEDSGFEVDNAALQRIQTLGLGLSVEFYIDAASE